MTEDVPRFYRVGGDNRIAGFLLAIANVVLLFLGTRPIAYIRQYGSSKYGLRFILL